MIQELTPEQIEAINADCPYGQGIFKEANGIPLYIKEPVIYSSYESGRMPGSCWDDENTVNEYYEKDKPSDHMIVLDKVLAILKPNISALQIRMVMRLIESDEQRKYGYYGDYDDTKVEWITLSSIYETLNLMD